MKKITKFPLVTALALSLVLPTTGVFASEVNDGNVRTAEVEGNEFPVLVNGVEIYVPYKKDEVHVEKTQSFSNGVAEELNIYDNETNVLLETYRVEDANVNSNLNRVSTLADDGYYSQKWVDRTKTYGPAKVTLRTLVQLYTWGSFGQINKVLEHQWQTNSGVHKLVNKKQNTISTSGKWPTQEIETIGSATIEATVDVKLKTDYTKAGFTFGGEVGTKIVMRKNVDVGFKYSVR